MGLFFEVFVEPVDEVAMPEEAVLGTEDPVGFVGEVEVAGVEATDLGGVVGCHALGGHDAEVELAVYYAEGGVPTIDEEVGGVGEGMGCFGILDPIGAAEIPVGEPELFGFEALLVEVEHTVVGQEGFEAVVLVVAGEPVDAVAAEGGATSTDAVGIDLGHLSEVVGGGDVVLHAESAVVAGDFFTPFGAEAGNAATVGSDDEVACATHDLEVPTGAPELADHGLGTAFAEEECGIGLGGVVVVGVDKPNEHVFAIDGLDPMFFGFAHADLAEDLGVDVGELGAGLLGAIEGIAEDFGGVLHGYLVGVDVVVPHAEAIDIVAVFGDLADGLGVDVEGEDLVHAAIHDDGDELSVVGAPGDGADTVVEVGGIVGHFVGFEVVNHEAEFIALVAVVFHAFPGELGAVVREDGVLVVAHDAVGDVGGFARGDVVNEDVAIGAEGVVFAGFLAAGVGYAGAVGREVELLDAAPRTHGALVGVVGTNDIDSAAEVDAIAIEISEIDVGVFINPVVPMTVHEVFVDAASGLVEAGEEGLDVGIAADGDVGDVDDLFAVGGDFEAFEAGFDGGDNLFGLFVDIHLNDIVATGEEDVVVVDEDGVELGGGGVGDADSLCVVLVGLDEVELGIAFVEVHVVVGVGIDDHGAVGAEGELAHFAQLPHNFGGEAAVIDRDNGLADDLVGGLVLVASDHKH